MFRLKITALAVTLVACLSTTGVKAEAAKIKKRTSSTYSCTVHENDYEDCMVQAEWPQKYEDNNYKIVKEAERHIGLHANKDRNKLQSIMHIDPVVTPWCAAFVNTILEKIGVKGSGSLTAMSFASYGKVTKEPKQGDIVVMKTHVGFFDSYEYVNGVKYVRVLGGNQAKMVKVAHYPASRVISYRTVS